MRKRIVVETEGSVQACAEDVILIKSPRGMVDVEPGVVAWLRNHASVVQVTGFHGSAVVEGLRSFGIAAELLVDDRLVS